MDYVELLAECDRKSQRIEELESLQIVIDAMRYRELRQLAYRFGVGNPSPDQLDKDLDATISGKLP